MFVRNRRADFRDAASQPIVLVTDQRQADFKCPHCRRLMTVHPCYGPDYIIVHSCLGCGLVWLDFREMTVWQSEAQYPWSHLEKWGSTE
jgi:hypothetical protein